MAGGRRRAAALRGGALLVVVGLVLFWLVRPWFHGLVMFFWTAPLVWLPPLLVLGAGAALAGRAARAPQPKRIWERPRDVPTAIVVTAGAAFALFLAGAILNGPLVSRSIYTHNDYPPMARLPAGGTVRLLPKEVAEQIATGGFNSPTEHLTDFHIVRGRDGLQWTALRTPGGVFRVFTKKSEGMITLDAEQTSRTLRQVDAEFKYAPGLQISDNLRWRLLKRHFLVSLGEETAILDAAGRPEIVVPYMSYKGFLIRRPVFGGVFVVHPGGRIEDLAPAEAEKRPELVASGRIFPEKLARRIQDAYAYKKGLWNKWFVHVEQTQISDTDTNPQPYLIDFGPGRGTKWVSVAQPYGRAFAVSAIFLTDTVTGKTEVWHTPRDESLTGNTRVLDTVRAVSIPGINFADRNGLSGRGSFRVVEPRPVFVGGRLVYLVSIIPDTANSVSKSVIVDAARNKLVAIFDNDTDPEAEAKTIRYLATGRLPSDASASPSEVPGTPTPSSATPSSSATPPGGVPDSNAEIRRRLDDIIRRQRELLRDAEELRKALRETRTTP
jgi:hypothetical protein